MSPRKFTLRGEDEFVPQFNLPSMQTEEQRIADYARQAGIGAAQSAQTSQAVAPDVARSMANAGHAYAAAQGAAQQQAAAEQASQSRAIGAGIAAGQQLAAGTQDIGQPVQLPGIQYEPIAQPQLGVRRRRF